MFKEIRIENVENVHQQQFNLTPVLVIFMIKGMENILILNYIKWIRRLDGNSQFTWHSLMIFPGAIIEPYNKRFALQGTLLLLSTESFT